MTVKGSVAELQWLNDLATKGWLLQRVQGNWYTFERTTAHYRIFSEYVPTAIETDLMMGDKLFKLLATVPLAHQGIQVVYTGSTVAAMTRIQMVARNAALQLKLTVALRSKWLNLLNSWVLIGLIGLVGLLVSGVQWADWYALLVSLIAILPVIKIGRLHKQVVTLRVQTQQYEDAWRPTMHVFLHHATALDLGQFDALGDWTLVGHSNQGDYWYDLRTLLNQREIQQALHQKLNDSVSVAVVSWLGLATIN